MHRQSFKASEPPPASTNNQTPYSEPSKVFAISFLPHQLYNLAAVLTSDRPHQPRTSRLNQLQYLQVLSNTLNQHACPPSLTTTSLPRPTTKPSPPSSTKVEPPLLTTNQTLPSYSKPLQHTVHLHLRSGHHSSNRFHFGYISLSGQQLHAKHTPNPLETSHEPTNEAHLRIREAKN